MELGKLVLQNLPLPYPSASFAGQTVVVTGSNVGLGLEAARHFTRLLAARVILAVRSTTKGAEAQRSIEASTGRLGVVEVWTLDMGTFAGTLLFIERALTLPRLDVLVLNAGVSAGAWRISPDGYEETLQINVLSTALLGLRLLPAMIRSAAAHPSSTPPHLVIISSEAHTWGSVEAQVNSWPEFTGSGFFDALSDSAHSLRPLVERYALSKLFNVYMTRELARLVPVVAGAPAVVVNAVNPGLCFSDLGRESGWKLYLIQLAFARSTEKGSRVYLDAAAKGVESHGGYVASCAVVE